MLTPAFTWLGTVRRFPLHAFPLCSRVITVNSSSHPQLWLWPFSPIRWRWAQTSLIYCSWSVVRFLGTTFARSFFIPKVSYRIIRTVPLQQSFWQQDSDYSAPEFSPRRVQPIFVTSSAQAGCPTHLRPFLRKISYVIYERALGIISSPHTSCPLNLRTVRLAFFQDRTKYFTHFVTKYSNTA
jgi:hypothetical protein